MQTGLGIGLCALGGFFGLSHGLYLRHKYNESNLGANFADQVHSTTGKLTDKVHNSALAGNYNKMVFKGTDAVISAVGG